jgi:hypothetical protein
MAAKSQCNRLVETIFLEEKNKADQSFSNAGDGSGWLVLPRQRLLAEGSFLAPVSRILDPNVADWYFHSLERSEYAPNPSIQASPTESGPGSILGGQMR